MRCSDFLFVAALPVLASAAASAADLASIISATHWSPCYFLNASLPSLHDGAAALAASGTTSIKLILGPNPESTYPWNTDWDPIMANVTDLATLASQPIWDVVFRGAPAGGAFGSGWDYSTFDLITYRLSSPGTSWNYWCDAITPADEAAETREFSELTAHLLGAFSGTGKTFILEHWEGDWSAHCGNYDASKPPTPEVQARMVRWLTARQAGVDAGRAAWCRSAGAAVRDCTDGRAVHGAAGAFVYHASEVNLIGTSMGAAPLRNNILGVIPFVRLDMVSYSSYDTQWLRGASPTSLALALDFIAAHHNATAAAPSPAVFIAEYGIAQVEDPDPVHVAALVANVNAAALSIGPSGARRAAYTFMWELFDNEVDESPQFPGGRCNSGTGPQFNASRLHGFWLVRPDGSRSPSWDALAGLINGTLPPPPQPGPIGCTFVPDTDVQGVDGSVAHASSPAACCDACASDARCAAAAYLQADAQCWLKWGAGERVAKAGVALCVPDQL